MPKVIFVNLPVKDLGRSRAFYDTLGFDFDERMCDENALCVVIDKERGMYVMLLAEPFFKNFTRKGILDAERATESIVALGLDSRGAVDEMADRALASGGRPVVDPMDEGFMYMRSFQDPDGHQWEAMWMDPAATAGEPSGGA